MYANLESQSFFLPHTLLCHKWCQWNNFFYLHWYTNYGIWVNWVDAKVKVMVFTLLWSNLCMRLMIKWTNELNITHSLVFVSVCLFQSSKELGLRFTSVFITIITIMFFFFSFGQKREKTFNYEWVWARQCMLGNPSHTLHANVTVSLVNILRCFILFSCAVQSNKASEIYFYSLVSDRYNKAFFPFINTQLAKNIKNPVEIYMWYMCI